MKTMHKLKRALFVSMATLVAAHCVYAGGADGGGGVTTSTAATVTQEAQLLAPGGDNILPLDSLGTSPQAVNGNTAAFLASGPLTLPGTRKVVVYNRTPDTTIWNKQADLRPDAVDVAGFGSSIALDADILVAAVYNPLPQSLNPNLTPRGVYAYHRTHGVWILESRLVGSDAATDTFLYGYSVAVSGNRVLVGAAGGIHFNGTFFPDRRHGAIYEFERSVSSLGAVKWTETKKITGHPQGIPDQFGALIAFNGDTLVIGGRGNILLGGPNSVALYQRGATGWSAKPSAVLKPSDLTPILSTSSERHGTGFGGAVAISLDTILVGGSADIFGGTVFGSSYVFQRNLGLWSQQAKLTPKSRSNHDNFAGRVSVSGDLALFGYRPDGASAGKASLFKRTNTAWSETVIASPGIPVEVNDKVDNFATFALVSGSTGLISHAWATLSREWAYRFR